MKENQQVEWKSTWPDDYLKWISGFANPDGKTHLAARRQKEDPS
jgi:ATP-dependent DNA helicase RecG